MNTQNYLETLVVEHCCKCGILFGMPSSYQDEKRTNGGSFHCPNGHSQQYAVPAIEKVLDDLKLAERDRDAMAEWYRSERNDHQHTRRRLSSTQGVVTRTKQRVGNGVCPCCSRHFKNLERHMHMQHPKYAVQEPEA